MAPAAEEVPAGEVVSGMLAVDEFWFAPLDVPVSDVVEFESEFAAVLVVLVVVLVLLVGVVVVELAGVALKVSTEARGVVLLSVDGEPPATRMRPSSSMVAVCIIRRSFIEAISVHAPLPEGSYSSAELKAGGLVDVPDDVVAALDELRSAVSDMTCDSVLVTDVLLPPGHPPVASTVPHSSPQPGPCSTVRPKKARPIVMAGAAAQGVELLLGSKIAVAAVGWVTWLPPMLPPATSTDPLSRITADWLSTLLGIEPAGDQVPLSGS